MFADQHVPPILCHKDQVDVEGKDTRSSSAIAGFIGHRPSIISDVLMRYRYRAYPTPGQAGLLAQAFGCARVVFNDSLALRERSHAAGAKVSDTEVQRQVVTLAKTTVERAWLAGVSSVALVQACNDSRMAYRNWWDSLAGRRKGRGLRHPRFRSKHDRQAIRLTRNGFGVTRQGVRVAKVGDVRLRWSRALPSEPSSVTIIRDPDGRYYASFVVDVPETPLAAVDRECGIDLGLLRLATVVASDGTVETVANPRHLRRAQRRLARAQRVLSRRQKGSRRRARARRRVAISHRKVREARLDHHHKLALRLVRENQAIHLETLSIRGMARTRLAKSIHDAGLGQLGRLIEEKAARYGRETWRVPRAFPSSQLCSACGRCDGPKPLNVRMWTCMGCGTAHDRDGNAARNILAAGQAERLNARGADVRPGLAPAICVETRTHRGAA